MNSATLHKALTGIFIIGFLVLIAFFQARSDAYLPPFTTKYEILRRNLLPSQLLPYVNFGFRRVLADYYWVRSIQDYASWDQQDPYYVDYLRNIVALDPTFKYPYLFNILAVPKNIEQLELIRPLAERGIRNIPASWEIPYYVGTEYYLFTKKIDPAIAYLKIAAQVPGAPAGVFLNYSSFVTKNSNTSLTAQGLLRTIYDTTDDETLKKIAGLGIAQATVTEMLQKGIAAFKATTGNYPSSIKELEDAHLVSLPEELKNVFTITIQRNGSFKIQER